MRFTLRLLLFQALLLLCVQATAAQTAPEQSAESLRAQLSDVEARQEELQERARQLDEAMKPENIERSLALLGSTRPEELREERRRRLEKDRESVRLQLDQLAASHARLEAAIATADAAAYRRSAAGPVTATTPTSVAVPVPQPTGTNVARPAGQAQKQRRRNSRRPRQQRRRRG
ncbi:MAG TPA: hypothetical protein VF544_22785 [Pyrinomonadaceae bacterium]|jgi:hypothetical protein